MIDCLIELTSFLPLQKSYLNVSKLTLLPTQCCFPKGLLHKNKGKPDGLNDFLSFSKFLMFSALLLHQKLDQKSDEFHI